jgi:hypothetical protein
MRFCNSQKTESVRSQSLLVSCRFRSLENIKIVGIFGTTHLRGIFLQYRLSETSLPAHNGRKFPRTTDNDLLTTL